MARHSQKIIPIIDEAIAQLEEGKVVSRSSRRLRNEWLDDWLTRVRRDGTQQDYEKAEGSVAKLKVLREREG